MDLGIRGYITKTPAMGGEIKKEPEDFYVEEIIDLNLSEDGNFAVLRVEKKNWETLKFVRAIAKKLGISQKRISFAGTKDKRALTVQFFTISGIKKEDLEGLSIRDAKIEFVGYSRRELRLGDLLGNFFRVRVVGAKNGEIFWKTKEELSEKGIPNFFGEQRFGTRGITHEVGKLILQRNYSEAFWTFVAKPSDVEEELRKIREELWNCRDPIYGLKELPKHLNYERTLLQKLREGKSEKEALLSLPKTLKMMFIHAYQSYIFNRLLSQRIEEFGELKTVIEGDWACYLTYKTRKPSFSGFTRVELNRSRVNFLVKENFAVLALPLVGYETKPEGWSKIALDFLAEDNLEISDFKTEHKEFSSSGSYRAASIPVEITELKLEGEFFEFYLPAGCYGTVLLREFIKS
ncbi:MAG: tRNA pseudouridine13 synthase [Archaeoglobaceae archaeon]|nr:tRNA pseudouridine13 synthase [Archaeoglobaceae archaeon]MDK2876610.1 tRNA pseudouridine13 synthase [Archaeoglobaceae archaeon]